MLDLIAIENHEGTPMVSSRVVAEDFQKEHGKVIRAIETHVEDLAKVDKPKVAYQMFIESSYENRGKQYKEYLMNRDGFSLLVMSFNNTKDVLEWKLKYIEAFNMMEEKLKQPQQLTQWEMMKLMFNKAENHDERITNLENNTRISSAQELELQELRNIRVVECLGGKKSFAYKEMSNKIFAEFGKNFKNYFGIPRYGELPKAKLDEAKIFIKEWTPATETRLKVKALNEQAKLDI